jgi:hypothetical protein
MPLNWGYLVGTAGTSRRLPHFPRIAGVTSR